MDSTPQGGLGGNRDDGGARILAKMCGVRSRHEDVPVVLYRLHQPSSLPNRQNRHIPLARDVFHPLAYTHSLPSTGHPYVAICRLSCRPHDFRRRHSCTTSHAGARTAAEIRGLRQGRRRAPRIYEGLFKLYQKDDHVYAEIQPYQLDRPFLCADRHRPRRHGPGRLHAQLRRAVGPRLQARRRQGPPDPPQRPLQGRAGAPVARAVETTYTDSVLHGPADPVHQPDRGRPCSSTSTTSS